MSAVAVREEVLQLRLKGLRLPAFLAHYAALGERALAEGWAPIEYLAELVEVEVAERADRRLKRLLEEAELPAGKTLASLEPTRYTPPMRAQITELCRGPFLTAAINVCLIGKPGTAKSHVLAAIARALVERGAAVLY